MLRLGITRDSDFNSGNPAPPPPAPSQTQSNPSPRTRPHPVPPFGSGNDIGLLGAAALSVCLRSMPCRRTLDIRRRRAAPPERIASAAAAAGRCPDLSTDVGALTRAGLSMC